MKKAKKIKVHLSKMHTDIGYIPVLSNFQTVNRNIDIFAAERVVNNCHESIFFMVRPKDAQQLSVLGYKIHTINLRPGMRPRFIDYGNDCILEQSFI